MDPQAHSSNSLLAGSNMYITSLIIFLSNLDLIDLANNEMYNEMS